MYTTIKADQATRLQVMEICLRKLNRPSRPVMTFRDDDDTMVISGCSTTEFASALPERIGKKIIIVKTSK